MILRLLLASMTLVGFSLLAAPHFVAAKGTSCHVGTLHMQSGHRGEKWKEAPAMAINIGCVYAASIKTSKGYIVIKLTPKAAPLAVNNFIFLATHHFYTKILFHRVIKGFMIQTGDPTGTGAGGPGYSFKIEKSGSSYPPGTVAMANTGQPKSNGSQFFICQGAECAGLDGSDETGLGYTIFGHVSKGMKVVDTIASVPVKYNSQGEKSSPIHPVYMQSVTVTESRPTKG